MDNKPFKKGQILISTDSRVWAQEYRRQQCLVINVTNETFTLKWFHRNDLKPYTYGYEDIELLEILHDECLPLHKLTLL